MKTLLLAVLSCGIFVSSHAQDCSLSSTGLTPLNDLGTGQFNGYVGGLYPLGQNVRPATHTSSGLAMAALVQPLDQNGNINLTTGKIVFLSIGMSNAREEFETFQTDFLARTDRNPYVRVVNGAQSGKDIKRLLDPQDDYWSVIEDSLARIGATVNQVQTIWFKQAEIQPPDEPFPDYVIELKDEFKEVMNIIKDRYPNVRLCYFSSRIYGNYYVGLPTNPEPQAYYNGWSVKWLIEDQLNGDPDLRFQDPGARSPWLSWSAYLWADGIRPRSDGLQWLCPDDFKPDGVHPSIVGRQKVSDMLMGFFTTDVTVTPWLLGQGHPPPGPPAAPSNLNAEPKVQNNITVTWSDNSNNEDGFKLERAQGSGAFAQIATPGAGVVTYQDRNLLPNTTYKYRVRAFNSSGNSSYSNIDQAKTGSRLGAGATISNYPNPFNPSTEIQVNLTESSHVILKVYNTLGDDVATLLNGPLDAGNHSIHFDAGKLAGGVYYYRLVTNQGVAVGKMLLTK